MVLAFGSALAVAALVSRRWRSRRQARRGSLERESGDAARRCGGLGGQPLSASVLVPCLESSSYLGPNVHGRSHWLSRIDTKKRGTRTLINPGFCLPITGTTPSGTRPRTRGADGWLTGVCTHAPLCRLGFDAPLCIRSARAAAPRLLSRRTRHFGSPATRRPISRATCHTAPGRAAHHARDCERTPRAPSTREP